MLIDEKLFSLWRGTAKEISVRGEIVVTDGDRVLLQSADAWGSYPARSLLKPFQFLAAGLPRERWAAPLKENRFAACMGSISATVAQTSQIEEWYRPPALHDLVPHLRFANAYPMDEAHRALLKSAGQKPKPTLHTCFSKHMAILEACRDRGWRLEDYNSTSHPYHARLVEVLSNLLNFDVNRCEFVEDGCTLPSPVLSIHRLAHLYRALASAEVQSDLGAIRELMLHNPEWVGGPGRVDTKIMEANAGKVIAKEGADGLWAVGISPSAKFPKGLGVVLKLAAGYHPGLAAIALAPVLEWAGLAASYQVPKGQEVHFEYRAEGGAGAAFIDISPLVDEKSLVWPNDVAYARKVSLDTTRGDHLTLSSIHTTLHLGAHADAPNHFLDKASGIDAVSIGKYAGLAQVIGVRAAAGTALSLKDFDLGSVSAKRVLFRTESFGADKKFNSDFVTIAPEVIAALAARGSLLVGIDTPSIDPFDSRQMLAHKAAAAGEMAILEGLNLHGVEDGIYELSALPLKLAGADASPVRATLRKI